MIYFNTHTHTQNKTKNKNNKLMMNYIQILNVIQKIYKV